MADGVTNIGAGWDAAPAGSAEYALMGLLKAGQLSGEQIVAELNADGYGSRGPAYYPLENGAGPFYALGFPHTYASIQPGANGQEWALTRTTDEPIPVTLLPAPSPAPAPDVIPVEVSAALEAAVKSVLDASGLATAADVYAARDAIIEAVDASRDAIQQQIDQAIKNAETSFATIAPVLENVLPGLAGLFTKK